MIKLIISIFIFTVCCSVSAEQTKEFKEKLQEYKSQYNFYSIQDTMYTIQSELKLPEGYSHLEPKDTSSYAYWISNFPIWHQYKSVGHWKGGKTFEYDEVSRVVHLPWSGPVFKDVSIPVRLIGEYYFETQNRFSFGVMPKNGKQLTYKKWLSKKPSYNSRGELFFRDDVQKENTEQEYYRMMVFSMQNVDYKSIAKSCDTVAVADIQAGDMLIAYNNLGKIGKLYVILHLIINNSGDKMYLVANGCPEACDFHIPKFNENRDMPWIDNKQLLKLTKEFQRSGFYRFKSLSMKKNKIFK